MAFPTALRKTAKSNFGSFAAGGTVDINVSPSGSTPTTPMGSIVANSSVPPPTATSYSGLGAAIPITQVTPPAQPYSNAVANVPVGGTSGAPISPAIAQMGNNGIPIGTPGMPNMSAAVSPLATVAPLTTPLPPSKRGGAIKRQKMAGGGIPTSEAIDPWWTRAEERSMVHPEGLVSSLGGGRTDIHPIQVPAGSYVVPADVTSGLAEGNTLAGSGVIDRMMHSNPYGVEGGGGRRGSGPPRAQNARAYQEPSPSLNALEQPESRGGGVRRASGGDAPYPQHKPPTPDNSPRPAPKPMYLTSQMMPNQSAERLAQTLSPQVMSSLGKSSDVPSAALQPITQAPESRGGAAKQSKGEMVPIIVAGGEHIIYPQTIIKKFGDLKKGHAVLDKWVVKTRQQIIQDMRKLKGPKK